MAQRQLEGFRIENVRAPEQPERIRQAVALWLDEKVLDQAEARRRAAELLLVAIDEDDEAVVGMATTYLATPPILQVPLWHFRTFVAPAFRQNDIAYHLLQQACAFHEEGFVSGEDVRGIGVYMEIENPVIRKFRNEAVWARSGMVFAGFGANGQHRRVRYFPGATVPPGTS